MICVIVRNIAGEAVELHVKPEVRVSTIKSMVADVWQVPCSCQKLLIGTSLLHDDSRIVEHCIANPSLGVQIEQPTVPPSLDMHQCIAERSIKTSKWFAVADLMIMRAGRIVTFCCGANLCKPEIALGNHKTKGPSLAITMVVSLGVVHSELGNESHERRSAAILDLGTLGEKAGCDVINTISRCLEDAHPIVRRSAADVLDRLLIKDNGALLTESSKICGRNFPPWESLEEQFDEQNDSPNSLTPIAGSPPTSASQHTMAMPELETEQRERVHTWRRLPEVASCQLEPMIFASTLNLDTICQGWANSSIIAALLVLAEYEQKFHEPLLSCIIRPQSTDCNCMLGNPVYSRDGFYWCRMFLNGIFRKVDVDDHVPVGRDGNVLCAHSSNLGELWVTLLEKAFLKIGGNSYVDLMSNSGIDIFHLTGWVPETLALDDEHDLDSNTVFEYVFGVAAINYHAGGRVVCARTSALEDAAPSAEERRPRSVRNVSIGTGLVENHGYPILDCRVIGPYRLLRMKNPWGHFRWRGRFSPGDPAWSEAAGILTDSNVDERRGWEILVMMLGGRDPMAEAEVDNGYFWIEWEDVVRHFSHVHLCKSPSSLGPHVMEAHGRWDPAAHLTHSILPDDVYLPAFMPQYLLRFDSQSHLGTDARSVWIVLHRHVRSRESLFVAVHIYQGSSRLCWASQPLKFGVYSNCKCVLVELSAELARGACEFVLVVHQHEFKDAFNFTLQVYASVPGNLVPLPELVTSHEFSGEVKGEWTIESSGGNSNNPLQYFRNPQWYLEVPHDGVSRVTLSLECLADHSLNIRIFPGAQLDPESLRQAISSGPYARGCCGLKLKNLIPGPYIIVVSTFQVGNVGSYRLTWYASTDVQLLPRVRHDGNIALH